VDQQKKASNIAAFFDFDGTLIRGESGKYGFKYLREKGFKVHPLFMIKALYYYIQYKREKITEVEMSDLLLRFYKGRREEEFQK
jgi:FMN phosphatase YigB (HAD superfamily)